MSRLFLWLLLFVHVFLLVPVPDTLAQQLPPPPIKDTLFLKNGTVMIGKLKGIRVGVITFYLDNVSDITVQVRHIQTMTAVMKIYRIETIKHKVHYGTIRPTEIDGQILINTGLDSVYLNTQDISVLYPYKDAFIQRFTGNLSVGFNYTKSSGFGTINSDNKLYYKSKKEEVSLSIAVNYSIDDSSFSRDREDVSVKVNEYFTPVWFGTVLASYQRNLELGMLRRWQEGLGAGAKFLTAKKWYAWSRSGFVLNQETNTENVHSGVLTELFTQVEFNFFKFVIPKLNFRITQTLYYSLSQKGRYRIDGNASIDYEAIKDLKLNVTFYNSSDSKPPGEEGETFDFGTSWGLKYTF